MRKFEISLLLAFLFCFCVGMLSFERECDDIRGKVLRLHILANSDSDEDQALKLEVRDAILEISGDIFGGCVNIDDASRNASEHLVDIRRTAQAIVYAHGYDYPVSVSLDRSYFSTRVYDDVTLPAGMYQAVRVSIGKAQGHNWWCVMFPMMCVSGASEPDELSQVLTDGQLDIVEGDGYRVRFKCVEIYEELVSRF